MNAHKNKIITLVVLLLLIIGGYALFGMRSDDSSDVEDEITSQEPTGNEVLVNGVIACLPFRSNVPEEDCVKAIKGDDGKTYALNTIKVKGIENTMSNGTEVTAIGVYQAADKSVDESSGFTYDGVLVVRTLVRR